ncbi:MAG: ATP-binding cassette domain-containing protein [Lentisphaerales bacterium]|nr:ATP-binding cassette domain-containing protein [Lentisphaerales bacterium]
MLKISNLRKVFLDRKSNEIEAVKGLSLDVEAGQILGLLGMNGAGKSTTLRMLSTVINPTSGEAILDSVNMHEDPMDVRRSIGFLSGSTGLYKRLTARETISWFAQLNGMTKSDITQRIEEIVELLNMSEFIDRKCEKLSTGQKQKVNIGRTIIHNPSLLILDEATTGLDVVAKQSIIDFIKHMKNDKRVILFSTHHMDEVHELCDSIAVLNKGELIGKGAVDNVLQQQNCSTLGELFGRYAEKIGAPQS